MRHERSIQLVPDDLTTLEPVDAQWLLSASIDDLRQWERLGGQCSACRRRGSVDQYQLRRDFGSAPLAGLQVFLHCTRCDNKGDNKFVVSKIARD